MGKIEDFDLYGMLPGGDERDSDIIPIVTNFFEDDEKDVKKYPEDLPILPLRNTVLFPGVVIPLTIGRDRSFQLIRSIQNSSKLFGAVSQRQAEIEEPKPEDLYKIGTVAEILKVIEMPDNTISVIIQGKKRFEVEEVFQTDPFYRARVKYVQKVKQVPTIKTLLQLSHHLKIYHLRLLN
jgi:ATP-dependent Lon protease